MAQSVFAADALTGASIICSPPRGQLKMQSLQKKKKPCCDPELQTEAAVMNETRRPQTSVVTKTRDVPADLLLGLGLA